MSATRNEKRTRKKERGNPVCEEHKSFNATNAMHK